MNIFTYMGDRTCDYRSLMLAQKDITIDGKTIPVNRLVICEQTHSDLVHVVCENDAGSGWGESPQIPIADGLITNVPDLYLLIRTADCFPVVIFDECKGVVAAVHSGREGTRKNIVGKAVNRFVAKYNSRPKDLAAIVGAGVCEQHYEVDEITWNEFNSALDVMQIINENSVYRHIDIRSVIRQQLCLAGLVPDNIEDIEICTYDSKDHFSFRRDGTNNRQINLIGVCNG